MTKPAHLERMEEEWKDLSTKVSKLTDFIKFNPHFAKLSINKKHLMIRQRDAMQEYLEVLQLRIEIEQED